MIALDTNLLVYAHRPESPFHQRARQVIEGLAETGKRYGIPFHCAVEFVGIVTHPKIWKVPSSAQQAADQLSAWLEPSFAWLLCEEVAVLEVFTSLVAEAKVSAGAVHDARIVATCLFHGVRKLWSADRNFSRFPQLRVENPLVQTDT